MGSYIIKVTSGSDVGTIENQVDIGFRYTDKLNSINEAEIKISGLGSIKRGLIAMGAEVEIYRNASLEFKGLIDSIDTLDAGAENIHVSGKEIRLVQEKGAYANSPWKNTASATINGAIIGESTYFTAGTVNAGTNIDFRLDKAQSLWNGLGNLSTKTGQDIQIDYVNDEVDILDHRGSSSSVATLNDGIHIQNIRVSTSYPKGNSVKVYGKGDGTNQIESDDAQGQDATSKSTYGIIREVIIDRSIISVSEANSRANIEVAKIKDPTKVYDFEVINPNAVITTGDVITLNSQDKDLVNEEVRVVAIERGVRGRTEYLTLQVTNAAYSQLIKTSNQMLGKIQKDSIDSNTYMQGSGNTLTWERGVNAKSGTPLAIIFQIPASFIEDEAGNLRVNSFTVDYDVDPYKKGVGLASDDGHVHNISSTTTDDIDITGGVFLGSVDWTENIATSWDLVGFVTLPAGTYGVISVELELEADGWTGPDSVGVRVTWDNLDFYRMQGIATHTDLGTIKVTVIIPIMGTRASSTLIKVYHYSALNEDYQGFFEVLNLATIHSHNISTLTDTEQSTADVSIGDDISDAGSVNASEVDIYLDFWNGSAWINKHSILNTGKTLDTDVDITDGGTYPDTPGLWRVRIDPDSGDPDYIQCITKIKHNMDS